MTTAAAVPWHDRHKGKIVALTIVGILVAILGVVFRADIWPRLVAAGQGLGALITVLWKWLWTAHGVPGWLLVMLILATAFAGLLFVRLVTWVQPGHQQPPMSSEARAFTLLMDGVEWKGHISSAGLILGELVPYCPRCQCQIRPAHGHDFERGGWSTWLRCEDCQVTERKEEGNAKDTYLRIARRIEARWRRGELSRENGQ